MNGNDEELWVDYIKKIALNISELNIIKEKVVKYPETIEDYFMEKGFYRSAFS